jgi:NADP-dependent 3-hydroxy acid dehydrogenase YdfG
VTGASSGIGRETALALARQGARVALAARNTDKLQAVAQEIRTLNREALIVPTDVTQQDQAEHLVTRVLEQWDRVDILVSNAGEYIRCPVRELSISEIERSLAVNLYGGLYLTLAVLPAMLAQQSGHILFVTSMDGKKGVPPDAPYVTAKFALTGFAEVLRQELRGSGVYVTNVLPGRVDTPMIATLRVPWISRKLPAQAIARAILRAIQRRPVEVITPFSARALVYLNTLSPAMGDWVVRLFHLEGWETETNSQIKP